MEKDKLQATIQELRNTAATGSPECCALVDKAVGALLDMAAEVEQVKQERDAAVKDTLHFNICNVCKRNEPFMYTPQGYISGSCDLDECEYEWRGPCS